MGGASDSPVKGKKVLVTGAAGGLGRRITEWLLEHGAAVGALDIRQEALDRLKADLPRVQCHRCDVTDPGEVARTVEDFCRVNGVVDILINNAGVLYSAPLVRFSPTGVDIHSLEDWNRVIGLNLTSVFLVTSVVVRHMLMKRTRGIIVNLSSVSAKGNPGQSAYSASKAGVVALTRVWAKELGPLGIRCAAVSPGFIDTPSTHEALQPSVLKDQIKSVPLRRLGHVDDIGQAVAFIIENPYVNGTVIEVDGGLTL